MINHITLRVSDLKKSKAFYSITLKPLGYKLLKEKELSAGFGIKDIDGKRDFWIKQSAVNGNSFSCLAFTASSKQMVQAFYRAGLNAGGKDKGKPGYREKYHLGYYAAYVLDPDGYNIEAVFDDPNPSK
jgi:catechol 2,3-dioxygenase-like lactoylglutathione lyase family enzyme